MASRRGIFFNSKSRPTDKLINPLPTVPSQTNPDTAKNPDIRTTTTPATVVATTTTVKKKIVLNPTKRSLTKTNYSGPRKIFSSNYKANRTKLNPREFFGGKADEYDLDSDQTKSTNTLRSKTIVRLRPGKVEQHLPTTNRQPTTCAELDETQSYIDDMDYLLTGFQPNKQLGDRCLSTMKFAELCLKPAFRVHLRTEHTMARIFDLLQDAPDIPSLNICTALIFYILSSDTLISGINARMIHLMFNLVNRSHLIDTNDQEYQKIKERLFRIYNKSSTEEIFYEQRFNTNDMILETLVNLSHGNLSESLRNEIRTSAGFDVVIDAVHSLVQDLSNNDFECYSFSDLSLRYKKVCRYMNMLEEFSTENTEQISISSSHLDVNRMYIAQYNQYSLFHSLSKLLDLSLHWLQQDSKTSDLFRDGCKTIMSILVILTNDCESNCDRLASDDRFFSNLFRLLVIIEKSSFTNEDKFDTLALTLNLLINLVQNTKHVYKHLMEENMPGGSSLKIYEYLAKLFCEQESSAAKAESHEENDWMMEDVDDNAFDEKAEEKSSKENGANFNRALQKAAGHMENTFVAAFSGVILAVILLRDRMTYADAIRELMPQKKFDTMAFILKKFFVFMHMSHAFTPSGVKILEEIISMILSLCG